MKKFSSLQKFLMKLIFGKDFSGILFELNKLDLTEKFNSKIEFEKSKKYYKEKHNLHIGDGTTIVTLENFKPGQNGEIAENCLLNCGGMQWCDFKGGIELGDNIYIGPNSVLFGAGGIKIGKNVLISPSCVITSHEHSYEDSKKTIREQKSKFAEVVIEDDVWLGANCVILPGVKIGQGSVIGAGAVVRKDVPAFSVAVGVPAEVIKKR